MDSHSRVNKLDWSNREAARTLSYTSSFIVTRGKSVAVSVFNIFNI